ncbi:MAG: hypothetical protein ACREON_04185 [Gemmatimonadaceae bacterium]
MRNNSHNNPLAGPARRCDYDVRARRYPRRLPEMRWGVVAARGGRVDEARQWLGRGDVRARYLDYNRDGRPEVVTWYDRRGEIIQRWIDNDRDGRADRVAFYEDGRVVDVIG